MGLECRNARRVEVLLSAPPDHWIALSENEELVGEGATFEEAAAAADERGINDPILVKIPQEWTDRIL